LNRFKTAKGQRVQKKVDDDAAVDKGLQFQGCYLWLTVAIGTMGYCPDKLPKQTLKASVE
jgi:hypothetical protein